MIQVVLRLDDPSETSDQEIESGILSALYSCGLRATFAVIPFRESNGVRVAFSPKRAKPLIDAHHRGIIEIALHGHSHINRTGSVFKSEFSGLLMPEQARLINEGTQHLERIFGVRISGFVPPWNNYNNNTLKALQERNFDYLSADWEMPSDYDGSLPVLPRTCHISQIKDAITEARRYRLMSPIIIAMVHHYDFAESGNKNHKLDMPIFRELLEWTRHQPHITSVQLMDISKRISAALLLKQAALRNTWLIKQIFPALSIISMRSGKQISDKQTRQAQ